jgi:hypothetical protein
LPNISRAGRRDEAARHDTGDAEKDGASALAVSILSDVGIGIRIMARFERICVASTFTGFWFLIGATVALFVVT